MDALTLTLIGSIASIIGVPLAIYFHLRSKKRNKITVNNSKNVNTGDINVNGNINIGDTF